VRILIFKRTHKGDPRKDGWFGIEDCMGRVRGYQFDAVIGIGGIGSYAISQGIARKLNWIGVGPRIHHHKRLQRGPMVGFKHFALFEEQNMDFTAIAPTIAHRLYSPKAPRFLFVSNTSPVREQEEVRRVLKMARAAPASSAVPPQPITKRNGVQCPSQCAKQIQPGCQVVR
jgi:hypothetical protein